MNSKNLVRVSNLIGFISIILLVYWVFTFISIQVFGFKVFRENITETFYYSILGILALMFGALIMNIMFNLTRIAEKHNQDEVLIVSNKRIGLRIVFALSFPLLFMALYGGDYLTSEKKEKMLIQSAKSIIEEHNSKAYHLLNYSFNERWMKETSEIIEMYSRMDKSFPSVRVLVADTLNDSKVFLGFEQYGGSLNDTILPRKINYIEKTSVEEREYLEQVFFEAFNEVRFSSHDGDYELFFPVQKNGKTIVLFFSERQRYGKMGS